MKKVTVKKHVWLTLTAAIMLPLLLLNFCGDSQKKIQQLPETDQEFLAYTRYIMSRSERKQFLSLADPADRAQFIKEFWKQRDPSPETEFNEFKDQYFKRIEEANRLYSKGSFPGWKSDRGQVLILLGPPEFRRIYPTGYEFYDLPSEIWLYGYYPVIFVDRTRSDNYELTTLGAWHVSELLKGIKSENPGGGTVQTPFAFNLKLFKDKKHKRHNLQVSIPYKNIVFSPAKKGFKADIQLHITIKEAKTGKEQTMDKPHTIQVSESQLEKIGSNYVFNIPLQLEKGKYNVKVVVNSKEENVSMKDEIDFKI